jgi:tetratricopeptide (TPR) repeat protein
VGRACGNLGNCYDSMGQYRKAIELHQEDKKIAEEVGDRAGVGRACGNLGNCYDRMAQYRKAIELNQEGKKIAEEVGRTE